MSQSHSIVFEQPETVASWDDDYYHPIAERYYDRAVRKTLDLVGAGPGSKVLDAGCGPGVHTIRAAQAGCHLTSIDFSQEMLRHARQRVSKAGLSAQVEFRHEDLTKLGFADASFEHIFSWGVVIHIPDAEKALDELARVLAPGGRLALQVTNEAAWDHKVEKVLRAILRKPAQDEETPLGTRRWYAFHGQPIIVWQFDHDALTRAMEARGLRKVAHLPAEFSEIQRRVKGPIRSALLYLNSVVYHLGVGRSAAATNILVFEKPGEPPSLRRSVP